MANKPNVRIAVGKSGRPSVYVNGAVVAGVIGVSWEQPVERKVGPDGWERAEKVGNPVWNIQIHTRFVEVEQESDGQASDSRQP